MLLGELLQMTGGCTIWQCLVNSAGLFPSPNTTALVCWCLTGMRAEQNEIRTKDIGFIWMNAAHGLMFVYTKLNSFCWSTTSDKSWTLTNILLRILCAAFRELIWLKFVFSWFLRCIETKSYKKSQSSKIRETQRAPFKKKKKGWLALPSPCKASFCCMF